MKQNLTNFLKYNKFIYIIYYYIMSLIINVIKLFIRGDEKLILFNSFAGRKFDDSPKAIFDEMKNDQRFKDCRIVWAFHQPEKFDVVGAHKIKTDSIEYFKTALAARVWITNSSVERGLNFIGKNTLYFNTWHGTPLKQMGSDIESDNQSFHSKGENHFDIMLSQGRYETEIFSRSFGIPKEKFLEVGLPRNDILANYTKEDADDIKHKLGLAKDKKVILYCPTFREFEKDENFGVVLSPPMDLDKWENKLGEDFILLFRAHYEVSKVMDIRENNFIRNMTDYPVLNDLMIIADVLISDYSSVFFDFSITGKPMFHFTYDYEKYSANRGMYFNIRDYIMGSNNEDGLIKILKNYDEEEARQNTVRFREEYVNFYGNATKESVDYIANLIFSKF